MLKTFLILLVLLLQPMVLKGSTPVKDSLYQLLPASKGQKRLEILSELGSVLQQSNHYEAHKLLKEALHLARDLGDSNAIANVLKKQGLTWYFSGKYATAMEKYHEALAMSRLLGDSVQVANVLHNKGMLYRNMGSFDKALEMSLQVLRLDEEAGNRKGMAYSYNQLGLLYENLGDTTKALQYLEQSLAIRNELNHKEGIAWTCVNLGNLLTNKNSLEEAEAYYLQALQTFNSIEDRQNAGICFNNLAVVQFRQKNYQKAGEYYQQAIATHKTVHNPYNLFSDLVGAGLVAKVQNNIDLCQQYYQQAQTIADTLQSDKLLAEIYMRKADLEKQTGNYKAAVTSLELHQQHKQKQVGYEKMNRMQVLASQYQLEKKEMELAQLAREKNLLKDLVSERENLHLIKNLAIAFLVAVGIAIAWALLLKKQSHDEIALKNQELQALNKALDRFVYSASHDLRAPLLSTLGLTQLMREENSLQQLQHYMDLQEKSLKKLDKFICEILDYSRNMRLEVKEEPVVFREIAESAFAQLAYDAKSERVEKRLQVSGDFLLTTDSQRLQVIINNLVSNAVNYQNPYQEQPFVEVSAEVYRNEAVIKVADNGIGIAPCHQQKVYDMFYRAHEYTNGSGLGLFIVREAIEKLQGQITLKSVEGEGTEFTIKIPNRMAIVTENMEPVMA